MKALIFWAVAGVLAAGCEKADEKPAPAIVPPKPETKRRPLSPPVAGTEPAKPKVSTATAAELDACAIEMEALAKQFDALEKPPANGSEPPDINDLQKSYGILLKRRTELMSGMTLEEKKEVAKRFLPSMKRIGPVLMKHRLEKAKARLKVAPAPEPAPGNVPEELLEELSSPPSILPPVPADSPPSPGNR